MLIPIKYNLMYLWTRKSSTLMTAMTFALVVMVFVIVMSLAQGLERAFVSSGNPLNVLVLRPGVQSEGQSSIQIDRYQIIKNFAGIAKDEKGEPLVAPEVLVLVNKPKNPDGKPSNLQIRGIHPQSLKLRPEIQIVEGRMFNPGLRQVVVSKSVSGRFQNMKLGDKTHLGKGEATVVGIFDGKGTAFDSEMWADYQELMQEFDRNAYNTAILRVSDKAAIDAVKNFVEEDPRLKLNAKSEAEYYEEQTRSSTPLKAFGIFLAVMMSIGACFAGMNTMYANVSNRTREIGTLRVLGFTPFSILFCFLVESVMLAIIGGAMGCLLALPVNGWTTGTTNFQGSFSEVIFLFTITPQLMGKGLIFAAIMGAVGGLLPAVAASREPILNALKKI
ncbi:ABC transporter permease [Candidatus Sumerlaeota bacterium]|nr:ABC transporter permease [Candidatus Sumerlaeota bacterium]